MGCATSKFPRRIDKRAVYADITLESTRVKAEVARNETSLRETETKFERIKGSNLRRLSIHESLQNPQKSANSQLTSKINLNGGAQGEAGKHETLKLTWHCLSRTGDDPHKKFKENQDSYVIMKAIGQDPKSFAVGVFDGHGPNGAFVSQYLRKNISTYWIKEQLDQIDSKDELLIGRSLHNSCVSINRAICNSGTDVFVSGSTGVIGLIKDSVIYVANVGDSRAVLSRTNMTFKSGHEAIELSNDQKPDRPDEEARIVSNGGRVFEWGVPRVWIKEEDMPGLAMSRSFGDGAAETVGVFAEPEVTKTEIEEDDEFLIFASDGIWEFLSSQEAVDLIAKHLDKESEEFVRKGCEELISAAVDKWKLFEEVVDDCTCCVIKLG